MKFLTAIIVGSALFLSGVNTQNIQDSKTFNVRVEQTKQTKDINKNIDNTKVYYDPTTNNLQIDFGNGDVAMLGKDTRKTNTDVNNNKNIRQQKYQDKNIVNKIPQVKSSDHGSNILTITDNQWKDLNIKQTANNKNIQLKSNIVKPANYRSNFGSYGNQQIYQNNIDRQINVGKRWNDKQYQTYQFQYGRNYNPKRQNEGRNSFMQPRNNNYQKFNNYQVEGGWPNKQGSRKYFRQQNKEINQNIIQEPYEILEKQQFKKSPRNSYNKQRSVSQQNYWPRRPSTPYWYEQQYEDYLEQKDKPWVGYHQQSYFPQRNYKGLRGSMSNHDRYCSCPYCSGRQKQRSSNYYY